MFCTSSKDRSGECCQADRESTELREIQQKLITIGFPADTVVQHYTVINLNMELSKYRSDTIFNFLMKVGDSVRRAFPLK